MQANELRAVCPECGATSPAGQGFCGQCGASLGGAQVVELRAASPAAVARAATDDETMRRVRQHNRNVVMVIGLVLLVICGCVVSFFLPGDGESPAAVEPDGALTPGATWTPVPTVPPFAAVEATVEAMTEAQWRQYLDSFAGQRVEGWTGQIVDVDRDLSGDYEAWVDLDEPGGLSVQDLTCPIGDDLALALNKGDAVRVSGVVADADEFLGSVSFTLRDGATLEVVK